MDYIYLNQYKRKEDPDKISSKYPLNAIKKSSSSYTSNSGESPTSSFYSSSSESESSDGGILDLIFTIIKIIIGISILGAIIYFIYKFKKQLDEKKNLFQSNQNATIPLTKPEISAVIESTPSLPLIQPVPVGRIKTK